MDADWQATRICMTANHETCSAVDHDSCNIPFGADLSCSHLGGTKEDVIKLLQGLTLLQNEHNLACFLATVKIHIIVTCSNMQPAPAAHARKAVPGLSRQDLQGALLF